MTSGSGCFAMPQTERQTNKQTDGHGNSAQRANSVKAYHVISRRGVAREVCTNTIVIFFFSLLNWSSFSRKIFQLQPRLNNLS